MLIKFVKFSLSKLISLLIQQTSAHQSSIIYVISHETDIAIIWLSILTDKVNN